MPGTLAIASCSRGSNWRPGDASIEVTPSLSSSVRSFRSMAAMPSNHGSSAIDRRPRLDGPVEVVGDGQHLADEVLAGKAEVAHPLLGRAPLEVLELGPFALERAEVLVAGLDGGVTLGGQRLDLGEQRRG